MHYCALPYNGSDVAATLMVISDDSYPCEKFGAVQIFLNNDYWASLTVEQIQPVLAAAVTLLVLAWLLRKIGQMWR